jgi:hypothetical protein
MDPIRGSGPECRGQPLAQVPLLVLAEVQDRRRRQNVHPAGLVPLLFVADLVGDDPDGDKVPLRSAGDGRRPVGGKDVELTRRGIVGDEAGPVEVAQPVERAGRDAFDHGRPHQHPAVPDLEEHGKLPVLARHLDATRVENPRALPCLPVLGAVAVEDGLAPCARPGANEHQPAVRGPHHPRVAHVLECWIRVVIHDRDERERSVRGGLRHADAGPVAFAQS